MNCSVVLGQCLAMRAQLNALIEALAEETEAKVICLHPEDQREYRGGMGAVSGFKCLRCDTEVDSAK